MADFPFDVVAFDLDGTLADTSPDLTHALNHALDHLGCPPVAPADVRQMVGQGAKALLRKGLAAGGMADEALVERGYPVLIGHYEQHIADESRPFAGCEAALDALAARGVKLAVCTNKIERLARLFIDAIGWGDRFAAIVGGDTVDTIKPDPAPVLAAIARAGGGRGAMIGDSINDTEAARRAGVPCIALTFGFSDRPPEQLGADMLIDHYDGLVAALERLGGHAGATAAAQPR